MSLLDKQNRFIENASAISILHILHATMPKAQVVIEQFRNNSAIFMPWPRALYRFLRVQVGTLRTNDIYFKSTRKYALCTRDAIMNIEHVIIKKQNLCRLLLEPVKPTFNGEII